jgi:hypothetical protein
VEAMVNRVIRHSNDRTRREHHRDAVQLRQLAEQDAKRLVEVVRVIDQQHGVLATLRSDCLVNRVSSRSPATLGQGVLGFELLESLGVVGFRGSRNIALTRESADRR